MTTVTLKLTKHFGNNTAGEVCGFTPATAAHIVANKGGEKLGEWEESTHRWDMALNKPVEKNPKAK